MIRTEHLENRVLKHLNWQAVKSPDGRKRSCQSDKHAQTRQACPASRKNCQAGLNNPLFDGLEPAGTGPNYVPQFDRRYQKIWKAYQMLVQRKATEELWLRRHRAWRHRPLRLALCIRQLKSRSTSRPMVKSDPMDRIAAHTSRPDRPPPQFNPTLVGSASDPTGSTSKISNCMTLSAFKTTTGPSSIDAYASRTC